MELFLQDSFLINEVRKMKPNHSHEKSPLAFLFFYSGTVSQDQFLCTEIKPHFALEKNSFTSKNK